MQIFISFRFSWMPKRYFRWSGVVPYSWRGYGYQTLSKWGSWYVEEITNQSGYQRLSFLMIWKSDSGSAGVVLDCTHISCSYVSILSVSDTRYSLHLQSTRWYWWSRKEPLPVNSFLIKSTTCVKVHRFLGFNVFFGFFFGGGGDGERGGWSISISS